MKRVLVFALLTALLGGCVVAPYGYRDRDDYYYHGHGYYGGDGYYRDHGYRDYHDHGR